MKNLFAILLLLSIAQGVFSQKISNIDFDIVKEQTTKEGSAFYYPTLIERLSQLDSTLTFEAYRMLYYGNVFYDKYAPYGEGEDEEKFYELTRSGEYSNAIVYGKKVLMENPINLKSTYFMLVCYSGMNRNDVARHYARIYFNLLDVIYSSGDGMGMNTSWVVLNVADEYMVLTDMELERSLQQLVGDTDVLTISQKGQKKEKGKKKIKKLYFNVRMPINELQNSTEEKE